MISRSADGTLPLCCMPLSKLPGTSKPKLTWVKEYEKYQKCSTILHHKYRDIDLWIALGVGDDCRLSDN